MRCSPEAYSFGFLAAAWLTVAHPQPLPLEHFSKDPQYESLRISPSGKYFAALVPHDDQNALAVIDREKMAVISSIRVDQNQRVGQFYWANDERIVAKLLQVRPGDDRLADYGELFAMDASGKRRKLIFGYRVGDMTTRSKIKKGGSENAWASVIHRLPNDPKHVLIVNEPMSSSGEAIPSVEKLNVNSGVRKQVLRLPLPKSRVVSDQSLTYWAATGADGEGVVELRWLDPETRDWSLLLKANALGEDLWAVGVADDGRWVDVLTNVVTPTVSLLRIDTKTGEQRTLISDERYDLARVVRGSDGYRILGGCYQADRPRCDYLDPGDAETAVLIKVQAAFTEQFPRVVNWTDDGKEAVLLVYADRNPGDYFLMEVSQLKVGYLLSRRQWIDPNLMAQKQPIRFTARDGLEIEGYLTVPLSREEMLPTVVYVHGGPHGVRDVWSFNSTVQMLASRGFAVLQVNYRGSGGYGLKYEQAGYRKWGTAIQDDITDGVRWAIGEGIVDPDRICISGGSFGGYSALMSVAREPELYQCAIGHVGVYDMGLMFKSGDIPGSRGGTEYLTQVLSKDPALHQAQSPVHHVEKVKAALLISYGKRDDRAPPVQSTRLTDALDRIGKSYELVVERREGHGVANEQTRLAFFQKQLAFLDKHIGPGELASSQQ